MPISAFLAENSRKNKIIDKEINRLKTGKTGKKLMDGEIISWMNADQIQEHNSNRDYDKRHVTKI